DFVAGFDAEVLASAATGARALLAASDFGLAAFLATAFFAGFAAASSPSVFAFFGAAFLAPRFALPPPPLAARSSISAIACASVIVSGGAISLGMVALTPPAVT